MDKKNIELKNELLIKYLCEEVSSEERELVNSWLRESEENRKELEQNRKLLHNIDSTYKIRKYNSTTAWNNVQSRINIETEINIATGKGRKIYMQFYKYAAIIIVAILLGTATYYFGFQNNTAQYARVNTTENQNINEITLPDGSLVTLNSNSKLVYPKEFNDDVREVTIVGEAFFDVKPNAEKPFIINAGNAQVKVLGTSFNVLAYPENETVEVVVATGKVQVINTNSSESSLVNEVFLIPGEKGTLFNSSSILEKSLNTNPNFLAWKTHDFIFEDVPLKDVFGCLEKVYHVNINVQEPELNDLILNAQFDKKSVDFILNVVGLTFDLELITDNEKYTFSSHKNN